MKVKIYRPNKITIDGREYVPIDEMLNHNDIQLLDLIHELYTPKKTTTKGLCPICGEHVTLIGKTADGRLIGSCRDAFTLKQWEAED